MSIQIEWYSNPVPKDESNENSLKAVLHPRLAGNGLLDDDMVVSRLSTRNGLSAAAVTGVLQGLSDLLREELAEGRQVHVGGLGYFRPSITTTERVTQNTPRKVEKVKVNGVNFRPEKQLVDAMSEVNFQRTKNPIHSRVLDDETILEGFKMLFAENRFITRHQVQDFFHLTPSSAARLITRQVKEHKLINVSSSNAPLYQSVQGCYI